MKSVFKVSLKILGGVFLVWLVLTLAQSATFSGVWELEKEFFVNVWQAPLEWVGTVVFWKSVVLAVAILAFIIESVVSVFIVVVHKCCGKKRIKKSKEPRTIVAPTPSERKANNETAGGVVLSGKAKTSSPSKFTRVHRK